MKRKQFLVLAFVFGSVLFINAQEHIVKVNPVGLLFGTANISYEKFITDHQSITVSGLYFKEEVDNSSNVKGFEAGVRWNYYFSSERNAPKGFHAGPRVGHYSYQMTMIQSHSLQ